MECSVLVLGGPRGVEDLHDGGGGGVQFSGG